ncbi:MAG: phosphate ABC transporter substrate-binding protein [Desulfobacteraceae bacterium]|nr:phosphate ABC transporter substrate-binding protein [Desulfobacteraceae bacterium]
MKKLFFISLSIFLLVSINCFAQNNLSPFKNEKGSLDIAGGTAHIPVLKEAAQNIMKFNPDIRITIGGGGSGTGIKKVGEGLIDIGNSGRKPTENEIEKYNLSMYKWAIDGVAVVINTNNPVSDIDTETLQKIFSGKITNWKELGGKDASINIYTRDEASGTRDVFWKKALLKGDISQKAVFISSNGAMKTAVSKDDNAIGYISVGHLDDNVKGVSLNGTYPDLDNVKSGKYTVSRGLYSNTKGEAKGLAKKFIDYIYSEDGKKIIKSKGFIPAER